VHRITSVEFVGYFGEIHRPTSDCNALLKFGVSDIGLKSSSIDFGGRYSGIATTFAVFQRLGTITMLTDELKI
jgi:hypothetical protein